MGGLLAAMAASLLVAACGGGGGSGGGNDGISAPPPSADYFPLAAGDRWLYEQTTNGTTTTDFEVVSIGVVETPGVSAPVTAFEAERFDGQALATWRFNATSTTATEYPAPGDSLGQWLGPQQLLDTTAAAGSAVTQFDKTLDSGSDLDGDGRTESLNVRVVMQLVGRESVRTPAQAFDGALHVRRTQTVTTSFTATTARSVLTTVVDTWYVNGVGRVRWEARQDRDGQLLATISTLVWGWHTEAGAGGVAPQVTAVAPEAASFGGSGTQVSAQFSMPMDAASLQKSGFTVTDGAGKPVAGTVSVASDGFSAVFVPTGGWRSGEFRATVGASAVDRVGVPAQPRSWSFSVDGVAPTLAHSTPADGATDVPVNQLLVFQFSEPLDPATVDAGKVTFTEVGRSGAQPMSFAFDGTSTVTLTPPTADGAGLGLMHGRSYVVSFSSSITDLRGNALRTTSVRFTVNTGSFLQATPVEPSKSVVASAIGDVTGDGRPDVVWSSGTGGLYLRAGRADGSLASSVAIPGAAGSRCGYSRLAIVDLDGDGRNDLVASDAGGACGARLFYQDAAGTLSRMVVFARLDQYSDLAAVTVADLNGDGRPDLVTGTALRRSSGVWLQDASGSFTEMSGPALPYDTGVAGFFDDDGCVDLATSAGSVHVLPGRCDGSFAAATTPLGAVSGGLVAGDLDGDGRTDLVVLEGSRAVQTFRRQADGSFAAGARFAVGGVAALALADVDGDGRPDLVAKDARGIGILLQRADGSFAAEDHYGSDDASSEDARGLTVGDVNGDGLPDVIAGNQLFLHAPRAGSTASLHAGGLASRLGALPGVPATASAPGGRRFSR